MKTELEVLGEKKHSAELKKRAFSLEEVSLFGHVASKDGNAVQLKKIEAIVEWERPTSVRQICSFLGFDGYSHGFTVRFSTLSGPPTAQTRKSAPKFWREQCETSDMELKQRLVSAPVLTLRTEYIGHLVRTFASRKRIASLLMKQGNVVAYIAQSN